MEITLGHIFVAVAAIDVVVIWTMTRSMLADERAGDEKRRAARIIMAAGVAASVGLVAFAVLHPIAQLRIA
jgi:hypothetical protein